MKRMSKEEVVEACEEVGRRGRLALLNGGLGALGREAFRRLLAGLSHPLRLL